MASEYVRQKGLPSEEMLRKRMIEKTELKMRTRVFNFTKNFSYLLDKNFIDGWSNGFEECARREAFTTKTLNIKHFEYNA